MAEEAVEQLAQKIWALGRRMDSGRIAEECGYPKNQYGYTNQLDDLKWDELPENVKDHVREMAKKELAVMQTFPPPSEIEQYLAALFRELERLRPTKLGVCSHGIVWNADWEHPKLLINVGDAASLHPLHPGDLTSDPIATAARLVAKVEPELSRDDLDYVGIKR